MKLSVLHAESVENYFMANGFPKDKVISGGGGYSRNRLARLDKQ